MRTVEAVKLTIGQQYAIAMTPLSFNQRSPCKNIIIIRFFNKKIE